MTRWRRYGHDRVYVNSDQGEQLGWHDLRSGTTQVVSRDHELDVREAIARWLDANEPIAEPTEAPSTDQHAPPTADESERAHQVRASDDQGFVADLSVRQAGELAREQASSLREAAPVKSFLGRVLGAHTDERAWRVGAKGEERVGSRLEALVRKDERWRVLHSIEVGSRGADMDHLVVGPGGVFTLNAKHHPRAKVWVGGDVLMVNGQRQPYVRNSRHEAKRASRVLSQAIGSSVHAHGVIVLVGVRELTVKSAPEDVAVVYRESLVRWLRRQPAVLDDQQIDRVYTAARRPEIWTG